MKNTIFEVIKYTYYLSLIVLLILYLFPGSLIGFLLYSDLGYIICIKDKKLIFSFTFLFCASIFFELLHLIIPNRAFEFNDLFANSFGVILAFLIFNLMKKLIN